MKNICQDYEAYCGYIPLVEFKKKKERKLGFCLMSDCLKNKVNGKGQVDRKGIE